MTDVATPNMAWDATEPFTDTVVWWTRLDNRYLIEAVRTDDSHGQLRVFDHDNDDRLLLDESVGFAYAAMFGPDVDDVAAWTDRALYVADHPDEFV